MRVSVGDLSLNYETCGEGSPLVLTHGLGGNLSYWDEVGKECARHHSVLRWDVRGSGASDHPPGPYTPAMLAQDLARLLDTLDMDRAHLVGVSMGGVISQRFALDFPDRVRSLVLVSTSSEVGERATANWQRLADRIEEKGLDPRFADATRSFAPAFAELHPEIVRALGEQTAGNDPHAYAASARAMSDYRWTNELRHVLRPALVVQGLDDLLTPPGGSIKMSRALPHSRLLLVPGAGHNLPIERPDFFSHLALAFTGGVDLAADVKIAAPTPCD